MANMDFEDEWMEYDMKPPLNTWMNNEKFSHFDCPTNNQITDPVFSNLYHYTQNVSKAAKSNYSMQQQVPNDQSENTRFNPYYHHTMSWLPINRRRDAYYRQFYEDHARNFKDEDHYTPLYYDRRAMYPFENSAKSDLKVNQAKPNPKKRKKHQSQVKKNPSALTLTDCKFSDTHKDFQNRKEIDVCGFMNDASDLSLSADEGKVFATEAQQILHLIEVEGRKDDTSGSSVSTNELARPNSSLFMKFVQNDTNVNYNQTDNTFLRSENAQSNESNNMIVQESHESIINANNNGARNSINASSNQISFSEAPENVISRNTTGNSEDVIHITGLGCGEVGTTSSMILQPFWEGKDENGKDIIILLAAPTRNKELETDLVSTLTTDTEMMRSSQEPVNNLILDKNVHQKQLNDFVNIETPVNENESAVNYDETLFFNLDAFEETTRTSNDLFTEIQIQNSEESSANFYDKKKLKTSIIPNNSVESTPNFISKRDTAGNEILNSYTEHTHTQIRNESLIETQTDNIFDTTSQVYFSGSNLNNANTIFFSSLDDFALEEIVQSSNDSGTDNDIYTKIKAESDWNSEKMKEKPKIINGEKENKLKHSSNIALVKEMIKGLNESVMKNENEISNCRLENLNGNQEPKTKIGQRNLIRGNKKFKSKNDILSIPLRDSYTKDQNDLVIEEKHLKSLQKVGFSNQTFLDSYIRNFEQKKRKWKYRFHWKSKKTSLNTFQNIYFNKLVKFCMIKNKITNSNTAAKVLKNMITKVGGSLINAICDISQDLDTLCTTEKTSKYIGNSTKRKNVQPKTKRITFQSDRNRLRMHQSLY